MYLRSALLAPLCSRARSFWALKNQRRLPRLQPPATPAPRGVPAQRPEQKPDEFVVAMGTRIPLSMINSVSTKTAVSGERVYLESVFPILVNGHVVIPPGSYVAGTVTEVKRPGRVKGRGELYVRFDSLTLPNGVTRDFRARMGSLDGRAPETLDKSEGVIKGEGDKAGDVKTVGEATGVGATIGGLAGAAAGHAGMGAGSGRSGWSYGRIDRRAADARPRRDSRQRNHASRWCWTGHCSSTQPTSTFATPCRAPNRAMAQGPSPAARRRPDTGRCKFNSRFWSCRSAAQ